MKDIDFDELDRAVNSLMGGMKDAPDLTKPKTLTIASTLKNDEQPAYSNIEQAAKKIGSETLAGPTENTEIISPSNPDDAELTVLTLSAAPVQTDVTKTPAAVVSTAIQPELKPEAGSDETQRTAGQPTPPSAPVIEPAVVANESEPSSPQVVKRNFGRFMDVMHSSSDMKTPNPSVPAASHVAATIAPSIVVPARPVQAPAPELTPAAQPEQPAPGTTTSAQPEIPAPTQSTSEPEIATDAMPAASHEAEMEFEELLAKHTEQPVAPEPLISPFLPDAKEKVEKRPLGGAQSQGGETVNNPIESVTEKSDDKDAQLTPRNIEPELPAELHTDLLAIETNELPFSPNSEQEVEKVVESVPASQPVVTPQVKTIEPVAVPQAPTNDQKSEETSPADTGAIFDTSEYHAPIAHPAKSKSGWLVVLIVVIIVIICAGGATAFYLINA